jgi:ribonuclease-3
MHRDLRELEQKLDIRFKDRRLLIQAFTHSSYVNENRGKAMHNERLEFLGDAVLELCVSDYLYQRYPKRSEGELTKLRASIVCEPSLVEFANSLEFGLYVRLGKGEEITGGRSRPALLADVFEAFIGALYLDQGIAAVKAWLDRVVFPNIAHIEQPQFSDYKTRLQEYVQQHTLGELEYRIVDEQGPAHDKFFVSEVYMNGLNLGRGSGRTKKEAEQQAAAEALTVLMHKG